MNADWFERRVGAILIAFASNGKGKLNYGSKPIRFERGDLIVLPIGDELDVAADEETLAYLQLVCRRLVSSDLGMAAPILPMRWRVLPPYAEEFERLLSGLPKGERLSSSVGGSSPGWETFMDWLLREPEKSELKPFEQDESPIRQALSIMGCRFMNSLSVTEISRLVAMSTRHFQRMFKTVTGKSFVQMLQEVRIRHSCGLLQFTRLSVQSVAETVGIFDMYSFYRLFQSHCGMTPGAFRSRMQS
ncbi:helix-turn-helix domain-containing protein [Cohnella thailandensis]|uniref:Helix-turn-helix transcriptional regulator n=1 Tax=Cohnella thailandensis TaxID=557557 RepID=A0A841SQD6_9BACL|nr:helix-turn-helix domain-containing protein [Cohnella thailandensis]MBB6634623.1 helix-turn-helix transcriptional regulator [Cohnella thailandensis]MBP1972821.1 AraC-like DNA-binding protein [Cohnella thailandensis]